MIDPKWAAAAAVAVCMTAGAAQAASYTFDLTKSNNGWSNELVFGSVEDPTVKVTASAGTYSDSKAVTLGDATVATWTGAGLGVCGDMSRNGKRCDDGDHRVDGWGTNDLAIFAFEKTMALTSISFSYFDSVKLPDVYENVFTCYFGYGGRCFMGGHKPVMVAPGEVIRDMFDLFIGDVYALTGKVGASVSFADLASVGSFGVGASGKYDAFKITSITAEDVDVPAPVPVPAGGLLLLTAMGGAAALKRRRKA